MWNQKEMKEKRKKNKAHSQRRNGNNEAAGNIDVSGFCPHQESVDRGIHKTKGLCREQMHFNRNMSLPTMKLGKQND